MEIKRKCRSCGKELSIFECQSIPSEFPSMPGYNMPSGGVDVYCSKCYKDAVGQSSLETVKDNQKDSKSDFLERNLTQIDSKTDFIKNVRPKYPQSAKIIDLDSNQSVQIIGYVDSEITEREINKDGNILRLGKVNINDETGTIELVLWNDNIEQVQSYTFFRINGYVKEFNGELQITLGKYGTIEPIE